MDLFGIKEHDERHDETERQIRGLLEQVAQLTIELGQARADIRRLRAEVETKVTAPDVDEAADSIDAGLAEARVKLVAAQEASEEAWSDIYPQLKTSLGRVREAIDAAGADDEE